MAGIGISKKHCCLLLGTTALLASMASCTAGESQARVLSNGGLTLTLDDVGNVTLAKASASSALLTFHHYNPGALLFCALTPRDNDQLPRLNRCWLYIDGKILPLSPPSPDSLPCGFGQSNSVVWRTQVKGSKEVQFESKRLNSTGRSRLLKVEPVSEFLDAFGEMNVIGPAGKWNRAHRSGISLYGFGDIQEYHLNSVSEKEKWERATPSRSSQSLYWGGKLYLLDSSSSPAQATKTELSSPDGRIEVTGTLAFINKKPINLAHLVGSSSTFPPSITIGVHLDVAIVADKETVIYRFSDPNGTLLKKIFVSRQHILPFVATTGIILAIQDTPNSIRFENVDSR